MLLYRFMSFFNRSTNDSASDVDTEIHFELEEHRFDLTIATMEYDVENNCWTISLRTPDRRPQDAEELSEAEASLFGRLRVVLEDLIDMAPRINPLLQARLPIDERFNTVIKTLRDINNEFVAP